MGQQSKSDKHNAVFATPDDIERAVEGLTPADQRRLEKFAQYKIRGLGRKANSRTYEDLLGDAITATLTGAQEGVNGGRRWRKDAIPFVQHLIGAMRSIASHWKEAFDEDGVILDCEVTIETDEGEMLSPVETAPSQQPLQDREVVAREELGSIHRLFQDDDDVALIIEGLKEGMTGPEVIEQLGIPKNRYEAGLKRMRYKLR